MPPNVVPVELVELLSRAITEARLWPGLVAVVGTLAVVYLNTRTSEQQKSLDRRQADRLDELRRHHDAEMAKLNDQLTAERDYVKSLLDHLRSTQTTVFDRRVDACVGLWAAAIEMRRVAYVLCFPYDILSKDEYATMWERVSPKYYGRADLDNVHAALVKAAETERLVPLVGADAYDVFSTMHRFLGRIAVLAEQSGSKRTFVDWHADAVISATLAASFGPEESGEMLRTYVRGCASVLDAIQHKLLAEIDMVTSGEASARAALQGFDAIRAGRSDAELKAEIMEDAPHQQARSTS